MFVPELKGRLRTFACNGITNVELSVSEFQRLVTFVHLEPVYKGKLWVRTDGDDIGVVTAAKIRAKFSYLNDERCSAFSQPQFERFYPQTFSDRAVNVLDIGDKKERAAAKLALLGDVLDWSKANPICARTAWQTSAGEVVTLLRLIVEKLAS
jgi:hypothetical protein